MAEVDMAVNDSFDQATLETMVVNMKRIVDDYANHTLRRGDREQELQDALLQQHLRYVDDAHNVVMRMANAGAAHDNRMATNAATLDHLASMAALTNPQELAEASIGAKVAGEVRSAAKEAMEAATAAVAQTSAAAQGTTGVAQGALQTGEPIWLAESLGALLQTNKALGVQMAKLAEALDVIRVEVVGDATE